MAKSRKITAVQKTGDSQKKARVRKRGKKVEASTARRKVTDDIFGFLDGKITITGDIVSPVLSPKEWGGLYPSPRPRRPQR